jgi:hypothetical protein
MAFFDVNKFAYFSLAIFCCRNLNFIEAKNMTDNPKSAEEYKEEIRKDLEEIRELLLTDEGKRESCDYICECLSSNPDLQTEFYDLWVLCDKCPPQFKKKVG